MTALEKSAREKLATFPQEKRCDDGCRGWGVFADSGDADAVFSIARCDECWSTLPPSQRLTDDEAAALTEAQEALQATVLRVHNEEHLDCPTTPTSFFAEVCSHCAALEKTT